MVDGSRRGRVGLTRRKWERRNGEEDEEAEEDVGDEEKTFFSPTGLRKIKNGKKGECRWMNKGT